jgi:hypothetical protein
VKRLRDELASVRKELQGAYRTIRQQQANLEEQGREIKVLREELAVVKKHVDES